MKYLHSGEPKMQMEQPESVQGMKFLHITMGHITSKLQVKQLRMFSSATYAPNIQPQQTGSGPFITAHQ